MKIKGLLFLLALFAYQSGYAADQVNTVDSFIGSSSAKVHSEKCWDVYVSGKRDNPTDCFMVSRGPIFSGGTFSKRSVPRIWVRHIRNNIDEVSVTLGYKVASKERKDYPYITLHKGQFTVSQSYSDCTTQCGKDSSFLHEPVKQRCAVLDKQMCGFSDNIKSNTLSKPNGGIVFDVIDEDQAWVSDPTIDTNLIERMIASSHALVHGLSDKGGYCSWDLYSLMGFKVAYAKMKEICDISRKNIR